MIRKRSGKDITDECFADFQKEINCIDTNTDDFILNSVIYIAPKKVTVVQREKRINDEIKNQYAIDNGWMLIRISYLDYDYIETILDTYFINNKGDVE